jgi:precorrin-2 dehydrogenase/sirohydrochlorin ferrochelatase
MSAVAHRPSPPASFDLNDNDLGMIPIALDPESLNLGLAGRGPALRRRLAVLRDGGASRLVVFCDEPDAELAGLTPLFRLPEPQDIAGLDALWITGLAPDEAAPLAALARARHVLVNVEDQPALSDFHSVAEVRRGDLLITVSTGGRSPALARSLRSLLAQQFGPEWTSRVSEIAALRQDWRRGGASMEEVVALTEALVESARWLP